MTAGWTRMKTVEVAMCSNCICILKVAATEFVNESRAGVRERSKRNASF